MGYDPVGVTGAVSGQSGLSGLPDEQRERRYWLLCGYSEAVAQISEERDVELDAGLHQAEQDIAGILACLTALLHNHVVDSLEGSVGIDGLDAQADAPEVPHDQLARLQCCAEAARFTGCVV